MASVAADSPPLALRLVRPDQLCDVAKLYKTRVEASSKKKKRVRAVLDSMIKGR